MAIKDVMTAALNTDWTITDNFDVSVTSVLVEKHGWSSTEFGDIIQKSLISVDVPTLTSPESDYVVGGERRIGVKIFEAFRFSLKFRDFEGGKLRRFFESIWISQQHMYFDDIKTGVFITVPSSNGSYTAIFNTTEALITEVSAINFDNTSSQIAEFSVNFIANKISDQIAQDFGSGTFINNFNKEVK